ANLAAVLVDLGPTLSRRFSKTWVKALDFPYLLFGFGGVIRVVNQLPTVEDRADNLDSIGLLFLAAAISLRLAKAIVEVFFDRHIAADYVAVLREEPDSHLWSSLKLFYAELSVSVANLWSRLKKGPNP